MTTRRPATVRTFEELAEQCREMATRAAKAHRRNYLLALAETYESQSETELTTRSP